jgi:uncharacterized DUF497 family protein
VAKFEYVLWLVDFLSKGTFYFQWDTGNETKNEQKHNVFTYEAEEVFFDPEIVPLGIQTHPLPDEIRLGVIGKTFSNKILFICFTMRKSEIRIISVRKVNKQEKELYEKENN